MTGIYKITNKINNKSYIGYARDIEDRWKTHKSRAFNPHGKEFEKTLYRAFRKYGVENFDFSVLLKCSEEQLSTTEIFFISYYDTHKNGYNETAGGEGVSNKGESHPNHKLTQLDVENIRTLYYHRMRKMEVRKMYPHIGDSGFNKVWKGETWKGVMPWVYSASNIEFHKNNTSMKGSVNGRARLTEKDVYNIRLRKKKGESSSEVYLSYKGKISLGSFRNIWSFQNWKNIIV